MRLLLTGEQRARLFALCQTEQADVVDVVTSIVAAYLDARDDLEGPPDDTPNTTQAEQEALQHQLRQLRRRATLLGTAAPLWLRSYIAEIEQELARKR